MSHLMSKPTVWSVLPAKTDQPGHPPSLIRVFAVRMKKSWVLSYPLSTQWRLIRLGGCPGWSEASFFGFVVLRLKSILFLLGKRETEQFISWEQRSRDPIRDKASNICGSVQHLIIVINRQTWSQQSIGGTKSSHKRIPAKLRLTAYSVNINKFTTFL